MQFPVKSILPPTKLQLCPDVPGVDQPGMAQGAVEHADEDRVFISSICSDYWSLQKAPEHVQQLQRCRGRERKGRGGKKKKITALTSAERPTGIFLTSPDVLSDGHCVNRKYLYPAFPGGPSLCYRDAHIFSVGEPYSNCHSSNVSKMTVFSKTSEGETLLLSPVFSTNIYMEIFQKIPFTFPPRSINW